MSRLVSAYVTYLSWPQKTQLGHGGCKTFAKFVDYVIEECERHHCNHLGMPNFTQTYTNYELKSLHLHSPLISFTVFHL